MQIAPWQRMDEQRALRQRVGWHHACHQHARRRRARDSIGSVTMPSARLVSAVGVAINSMRLISGRDELEAYHEGLRRDHAVYQACEGHGSHGPRDDARGWARGIQASSGRSTRDAGTHSG